MKILNSYEKFQEQSLDEDVRERGKGVHQECDLSSEDENSSQSTREIESRDIDEPVLFQETKHSFSLVLCAFMASVNAALLGYDVGVMSGASLFIKKDLQITATQLELLIGVLNLIAMIGTFLATPIGDIYGRKQMVRVANVVVMVGCLWGAFSPNFGMLFVGRLITGLGIGGGFVVSPLYLAEIAPPNIRGRLISLCEIAVNLGILLGYAVSFAISALKLSASSSWRFMIGLGALPPVFLLCSLPFLPESPRWLASKGRTDEARQVLRQMGTSADETNSEIENICQMLEVERLNEQPSPVPWLSQGWYTLLRPSPLVKKMLLIGVGTAALQQSFATEAIIYYTPLILKSLDFGSNNMELKATVFIGVVKCLFIIIAIPLMDYVGRRPLLLTSAVGCSIALALVSVCLFIGPPAKYLAVLSIAMSAAAFSLGWGPVTWTISAEIFPQNMRIRGLALANAANRLSSASITITFLSFTKLLTFPGYFVAATIIATLSGIFVYWNIPETKNRTLEQVFHDIIDSNEFNHSASMKISNNIPPNPTDYLTLPQAPQDVL